MDKKYLETELERMDWPGMILTIKIIPSFTFLFPYAILNIKNCDIFKNHLIDFMIYMENEKINTINFGPFRIDLNIHPLELNKNNFTLTFILDEYVQDKWNYIYTQKKLHEYNIIKNFNASKGYDETVEEIETVIADMNNFNNSN